MEMEKKTTTAVRKEAVPALSLDKRTSDRLIISDNLEHKIRLYCALSPQREWSGVLFYTFAGDFEKGVTIYANDMYLMDQGSAVHTEFDLNEPEITRYMVTEGLTDHCIGLLHSHNKMAAFFSGEDASTLYEYGMEMNNFVSLVVNNAGKYVARVTRKIELSGEEKTLLSGNASYKFFNTENVVSAPFNKSESKKFQNVIVEYFDLKIEKPQNSFELDSIERFGEINTKCSKENVTTFSTLSQNTKGFVPNSKKDEPVYKQGKLFDDDLPYSTDVPTIDDNTWRKHGYYEWFNRLLNMSPISTEKADFRTLSSKYRKAFKTPAAFEEWFEVWITYMLDEFDWSEFAIDYNFDWEDEFNSEEMLLERVVEDIQIINTRYGLAYAEEMLGVIRELL